MQSGERRRAKREEEKGVMKNVTKELLLRAEKINILRGICRYKLIMLTQTNLNNKKKTNYLSQILKNCNILSVKKRLNNLFKRFFMLFYITKVLLTSIISF